MKRGDRKPRTPSKRVAKKSPPQNKRKRATPKRTPRKRTANKHTVLHVKKGVRQAVYGFYTISVVFLILVMISLAFLLYQWKNYQITEYVKDIQQLKAEVLRLDSERSRYQARINTELMKYYRIARVAEKKLGLKPAIQKPTPLTVNKQRLQYYVQKDQKEKE